MNLNSQLQLARLQKAKQNRFNPLPGISDPTQLTRKLGAFEVGYRKDAVKIRDSLEQRDDQSWTVLIGDSITLTNAKKSRNNHQNNHEEPQHNHEPSPIITKFFS